jgi:hypothetical protein
MNIVNLFYAINYSRNRIFRSMIKLSIDDIKTKVDELSKKINVPDSYLPTYGQMKYDAHPYIEIDDLGFVYYVVSERGTEFERKKARDIGDILYWIFERVTFRMAFDFELKNRIEDQDCRRIAFNKQEELLRMLDKKWEQMVVEDHKKILLSAPFDDLAGLRATFCGQLRELGHTKFEIDKIAYERYPKTSSQQ